MIPAGDRSAAGQTLAVYEPQAFAAHLDRGDFAPTAACAWVMIYSVRMIELNEDAPGKFVAIAEGQGYDESTPGRFDFHRSR